MLHHRGTEDTEGASPRRSSDILGAAIEVHRRLGPGLLESAYESCLCREMLFRQIPFERQIALPLHYRGMKLDCGYRIDVIAYGSILVEVKAVTKVLPIHRAQVLTYLKLTGIHLGLLLNFNVELLRSGIYRIVNE
jgi:GxxExxY protein